MKSSDGRFSFYAKDTNDLPAESTIADVGLLEFQCRSQAGSFCTINIANAGHQIPTKSWRLSGSFDEPTIAPSINCENCWHGYIERGVFVTTDKQREVKQ